MHMADALLSPQVGCAFWGLTAGTVAYCSNRVRKQNDDSKIPLMGVLAAFIFAAQMINFTIPATGSSGHLGGGMILAILLGPAAAFLSIASVLVVQAFFFADGGLLALGCNIFNLGFLPAFIAYPFMFKPLAGTTPNSKRLFWACLISAVVSLQLGSAAVVLETHWSGISALPLSSFLLVMQPIHLAIGLVEGIVTAAVIKLIWTGQPDLIQLAQNSANTATKGWRKTATAVLFATALIGGVFSWYASSQPDGLEWSIDRVITQGESLAELPPESGVLVELKERIALLPDYAFSNADEDNSFWLKRLGSSVSGLVGATLSLGLIVFFGLLFRKRFSHD